MLFSQIENAISILRGAIISLRTLRDELEIELEILVRNGEVTREQKREIISMLIRAEAKDDTALFFLRREGNVNDPIRLIGEAIEKKQEASTMLEELGI